MARHDTDREIRTRIDSFLSELSALVKRAALESVNEALGGGAPARRGPGRPKGSGGARPRSGGRIRRTADDLAKIGARVLAQVRSNQGQRLEEIGRALRTDTGVLKKPIAVLLAAKKLETKGQKRGTKYFPR
jgi:hypothetical protein